MADSDKDILITPNVSQTSQPEIKLVGKDNSPMYLKVLDDNTLSFEGTEGQVFSISPTMSSGDIFSVNDISGIQSMKVNADGTVAIAPVSGNVGIGVSSPATKLDVAVSTASATNVIRFGDSGKGYLAAGTSYISLATGDGTTRIAVDNGGGNLGNVGIGTTTPSTKLDVNGTINTTNLTIGGAQGTDGQVLTSTGSGVAWEDATGGGGAVDSIANFSNNRILTASDSDSINGEANLTFDGSDFIVKGGGSATNALTEDPIVLIRPQLNNSRDATLKIQGARNGSTTANTATLLLSNQDDNLANANEFNHLGAIVGRVTDTTDNHGDMHFLTFSDGATANDTMTLKGDGTISISGNISSTSANNYNLYWPLYFQRDNLGTSNIDMRMPVGGAGTSSPNAMAMPRAGNVMAVTFHYYGGTLSTDSTKSDTWRIRHHSNGTADQTTKDIVVTMDTLVPTSNANQRVKTVELSTPFPFAANDAIGFKRHANANSNSIHEVVAVLWCHYDA